MRPFGATLVVGALVVSACTIGKTGKDLTVSATPDGVQLTWIANGKRATGKLVAVRASGLVVSSQAQLLFVPLTAITRLSAAELGSDYGVKAQGEFSSQKLDRLRLVSQFPQGLTPEVESRLLAQMNKSAIDTVR